MTTPLLQRLFPLVLSLLLVVGSCLTTAAHAGVRIRAGLEQNPPLSFINEQGQASGLLVELLDDIAAREKWTVEYVPDTFDRCLDKLKQGEIDLMVTIAYTRERAEVFDFNRINVVANWGQIYTPHGKSIQSYFDLEGKRIAVMRKDTHHLALRAMLEKFGVHADYLEVDNFKAVFTALEEHAADAGVVGRFFALANDEKFHVQATPIVFNPIEVHYAVRKGTHAELLTALDRRLTELKSEKSSLYYQALDHWFGIVSSSSAKSLPRWAWGSLLAGGVLLILLFWFNFLLRLKVKQRTEHLQEEIDTRIQAQKKLAESEFQYRQLVENVNAIILRITPEGRLTFVNDYAERFFGYSQHELLGQNIIGTIVPPVESSGRDLVTLTRDIFLHPDAFLFNENENLRKDGSRVWVSWRNQPVTDQEGRLIEILSVGQDITQRKKIEEALRTSERSLAHAQQMARLGNWEVDAATNTLSGSKEFYRILGLHPGHLALDDLMQAIHPDDRERALQRYQQALRSGLPCEQTQRIIRQDNQQVRWIHFQCSNLKDPHGRVIRSVGTLQDVTQQKEMEESLRQARDAADAANRAKSDFLAMMSHEIRTPMNGVMGAVQLLRADDSPAAREKYLDILESCSVSLLALIDDILDLSRIEAGKLILNATSFSPKDSLREVTRSQLPLAEEKGLELQTLISDDLPAGVRGDQARFRQIMVNLIGNALKFTITGKVTVAAQPLATRDGSIILRFSVNDTGIGMTAETIQRIFAPFEQADTSSTRQYGGAGLGLTICRRLVNAMGGEIRAASTVGSGSTFTVDLPFRLAPPAAPDVAPAADESATQPAIPQREPIRLLIAEDNLTNSQLLQAMLRRLGIETVSCAENGKEAVKQWQTGEFDLILMDVQMPVMDGIEATRFIRSQETGTGRHTPIVAITAHAMVGDRERILAAGMDDYLKKPFKSEDLAKLLQKHARQQGAGT